MIGNTDWSIPGLHNIKLVKAELDRPPYAVPYDFDFAGIISVPYAKPLPMLPIKSVKDRLFRGFCRPEGELNEVLEEFRENEEKIYAIYQDFYLLEEKYAQSAMKYIDELFRVIDDQKSVWKEFTRDCRTK
ncbi:MAG: hypothetical protein ACOCWM_04025 [Cyclobacteriaceae bacterium]